MTKYERAKHWARRHEDAIVLGVVAVVVIGVVIVAAKANISYQEQMTAELNGYIDELNALYRSKEMVS
jgi:hypothetical protein